MKKPLNNIARKKIFYIALFSVAILATIRYLFLNPISPDSWTHMAIGKIIVEQQKIPSHQDISFKQSDLALEWISHSWLAGTLIFLSSSINLRIGTLLLIVPILAASLFLLFLILKLAKQSDFAITITMSLTSILAVSFFRLHPLTLILPLLLALYYCYVKWYQNRKKYIFLWPLIFFLWANLAGGFIFIPTIFCLSVVITEYVRLVGLREKDSPSIKAVLYLSAIFCVSILVTLINPLGIRIWFYVFTFLGVLQTKNWLSTLPGFLLLLNQNFIRQSVSTLIQSAFVLYAGLIIILTFTSTVHKKLTFVKAILIFVPCLTVLFFGFAWIRFIPLSVFASAPLFGYILTYVTTGGNIYTRFIRYGIAGSILVLSMYVLFFPPNSFDIQYPKTQVELIKTFELPGNTLTTADITGFMLYNLPQRKVLLDAQDDLFDENETVGILYLPNYISEKSLNSIIDLYSINSVLVSKDIGGFSTAFNKSPNYALLYFDYDGFLFVERSMMPQKFIEEHSLLSIDISRNLGFNPDVATASAQELEHFTRKYPVNKLALGQLATIYRYLGDTNRAEQTLLKIPKDGWNYIVYTEMGRTKAAAGDCKSSEYYYKEALNDRKEQNFSRAILDLAVLYALCFDDKKQAAHYFNRYNSFVLDATEREKVRELADELGIDLQE